MSSTAKVSISVPDEGLLKWAKERSAKLGVSLSALVSDALRFERQMEARRAFVAELGAAAVPTPEEAAAIRAELGLEAVRAPKGSRRVKRAAVKRSRAGAGAKR